MIAKARLDRRPLPWVRMIHPQFEDVIGGLGLRPIHHHADAQHKQSTADKRE
jgi:hypothetical protein